VKSEASFEYEVACIFTKQLRLWNGRRRLHINYKPEMAFSSNHSSHAHEGRWLPMTTSVSMPMTEKKRSPRHRRSKGGTITTPPPQLMTFLSELEEEMNLLDDSEEKLLIRRARSDDGDTSTQRTMTPSKMLVLAPTTGATTTMRVPMTISSPTRTFD
jgi:hypothetical protein